MRKNRGHATAQTKQTPPAAHIEREQKCAGEERSVQVKKLHGGGLPTIELKGDEAELDKLGCNEQEEQHRLRGALEHE